MPEKHYLLSLTNFYSTTEQIFSSLSSRGIKLKKSDVKEAFSDLLGFENSNILDTKLKASKELAVDQFPYDKFGRHKVIKNLVLNRSKNPLKISDFLKRNLFTIVINFSDDFQASGSIKYERDDVLFAKNKYEAVKTILNWDAVTKLEYKYLRDEDHNGYMPDPKEIESGYWALTFIGNGDEQTLGFCGTRCLDSYRLDGDDINCPTTPIENVTQFFINNLLETEQEPPFYISDRNDFESFLDDWIEEFYDKTYHVSNESEFTTHIRRFLPYVSIDEIAEIEIGKATIEYAKILQSHGANLKVPNLLYQTVLFGNIETSNFLLLNGNKLDHLYQSSWNGSSGSYMHDKAIYTTNDGVERHKLFYSTAKELGVDLDKRDSDGNTPLHYAAKYGKEELYDHLVCLGANEKIINENGKTPFMLIEEIRKYKNEKLKDDHNFNQMFDDIFVEE